MEVTEFIKSDEEQIAEMVNELELLTVEERNKKQGLKLDKNKIKPKKFKIGAKAAAKNIILTAKEKDEVAGVCWIVVCSSGFEKTAEIAHLIVKENYRKSGIGTKLMEEAKKILTKEGVDVVLVSTPIDEAKNFYEKQGFILDKNYWLFWKPK